MRFIRRFSKNLKFCAFEGRAVLVFVPTLEDFPQAYRRSPQILFNCSADSRVAFLQLSFQKCCKANLPIALYLSKVCAIGISGGFLAKTLVYDLYVVQKWQINVRFRYERLTPARNMYRIGAIFSRCR